MEHNELKEANIMFTIMFMILKILLGMGLAGILIIIGLIAIAIWLVKRIIVELYYAIHHSKKNKGGD